MEGAFSFVANQGLIKIIFVPQLTVVSQYGIIHAFFVSGGRHHEEKKYNQYDSVSC